MESCISPSTEFLVVFFAIHSFFFDFDSLSSFNVNVFCVFDNFEVFCFVPFFIFCIFSLVTSFLDSNAVVMVSSLLRGYSLPVHL